MAEPSRAKAIADSLWFWLMLFSAAALVALSIIAPKYAQRQRRLEMQYHARQEITRRQVEGAPRAREPGEEGEAPPPQPGELIIPLWPLGVLLGALLTGSALMTWRNARRAMTTTQDDGGA